MHRIRQFNIGLVIFLVMGGVAATGAQDVSIRELQPRQSREEYFSLLYNQKQIILRLPQGKIESETVIERTDLKAGLAAVSVATKPVFDSFGVHINDSVLSYTRITDLAIADTGGFTLITFFTSPTATDRTATMRRGNRITYSDPITVGKGEFVRGMVFTVLGTVKIDGEINKDVVSLFDNITVTPTAVIRGDIASVGGRIDVAREASVYGATFTGIQQKRLPRLHRLFRSEDVFSWSPFFYYNRVDGATPNLEFRLRDPDSTFPTVSLALGYAFASSRWRIQAGVEQYLYRPAGLAVGGMFYRDLLSGDDWLLSDKENTVFALMVTEDFKDYYEAIGGQGYLKVRPLKKLEVSAGYQNEATNWLRAHRNLWSLFGGAKHFPENFATVPPNLRDIGIQQIDTGNLASVYGTIDYDERGSDPFAASAWVATLTGEISHTDLGSDFDFKRFTLSLRRYQKILPSNILLIRGMVGGSDSPLPMHRAFYLGGLGTLHGYRFKELMGNRFWMANFEFRQTLFRTDFALAALYDVGQIGSYRVPLNDLATNSSIGGALYLGEGVKIIVARRLDGSKNEPNRVYVRLKHVF